MATEPKPQPDYPKDPAPPAGTVKEAPPHGFTKTAAGDLSDRARDDAKDTRGKARITWLGEPGGADTNTWGAGEGPRITFEKGKSVEVDDERLIAKARTNPYFKVAG